MMETYLIIGMVDCTLKKMKALMNQLDIQVYRLKSFGKGLVIGCFQQERYNDYRGVSFVRDVGLVDFQFVIVPLDDNAFVHIDEQDLLPTKAKKRRASYSSKTLKTKSIQELKSILKILEKQEQYERCQEILALINKRKK